MRRKVGRWIHAVALVAGTGQVGASAPRTIRPAEQGLAAGTRELARTLARSPALDAAVRLATDVLFATPPGDRLAARYPLQEKCLSTVFGSPGDRWAGGPAACTGLAIGPLTLGIAHRTAPCGTPMLVTSPRTGRSVIVPVIDRGPYGALLDDGTWLVKKRPGDPGAWRGCADLTPLTALLLGHDGWDIVHLAYDRLRRRPVI